MTKPTTIEEVLDDFGHLVVDSIEKSRSELIGEALAAIEQLVLEKVIGDLSSEVGYGATPEVRERNLAFAKAFNGRIRKQRQALTQLLRGGKTMTKLLTEEELDKQIDELVEFTRRSELYQPAPHRFDAKGAIKALIQSQKLAHGEMVIGEEKPAHISLDSLHLAAYRPGEVVSIVNGNINRVIAKQRETNK